jgi:hypothetical protein
MLSKTGFDCPLFTFLRGAPFLTMSIRALNDSERFETRAMLAPDQEGVNT